MKLYECLELVRQRSDHYVIEIDGRQHKLLEFARNGNLGLLQAEATLFWQQIRKLYPDEQVGFIEIAGEMRRNAKHHPKQHISIRYRP